jgi:hypothetical protein
MSRDEESSVQSGASDRRVLLECEDPAVQDGLERVLRESGYAVSVCAGPASRRSGCPLVEAGRCGLVDGADLIVHALDPGDVANRAVVSALVRDHPDIPIVVEANLTGDEVPGTTTRVRFPMSRAALLDALQRPDEAASS